MTNRKSFNPSCTDSDSGVSKKVSDCSNALIIGKLSVKDDDGLLRDTLFFRSSDYYDHLYRYRDDP